MSQRVFPWAWRVAACRRRACRQFHPRALHHSGARPPDALAGLDVLAKSPTGSGKTLAFALPIVERVEPRDGKPSVPRARAHARAGAAGRPTSFASSRSRGAALASVYGGVPLKGQAARAREAHVVVATPGPARGSGPASLIGLDRIRILVLDEADRMLDMGFQPQVDKLVGASRRTGRRCSSPRRSTARSARSPKRTPRARRASKPSCPPTGRAARSSTTSSPSSSRRRWRRWSSTSARTPGSRSSSSAPSAAPTGSSSGSSATASRPTRCHGDMSQSSRRRALDRFESGKVSVLVATDVAARGLDIDDVEHVINFDPPDEDKGYLHRTGRTGRAGEAESPSRSSFPSSRPRRAASPAVWDTASNSRAPG